MRVVFINAVCGGVIGMCFEPSWKMALGLVALAVVIVNSMTWRRA
jgi:hypothetical protein